MHDDFEVPEDCSELTDQEWAEHKLIEQYLEDEELMAVALACERGVTYVDMVLSQLYFALAKRDGDSEKLGILVEIVQDKLKIRSVKLGVPDFAFFS